MHEQEKSKEQLLAELIIANKELAYQSEEKGKRADELIIANKELAYQNQEKENRAEELIIANEELAYQNQEKENRAEELIIANEELAYQSEEKEKLAAELLITINKLDNQNIQNQIQMAELSIFNTELKAQNIEIEEFSAKLQIANKKLIKVESKLAKEKLKESENMLQTVIDNFPGVVFWKDRQSNYLGCNNAFSTGAGLKNNSKIVGKTDHDMPWALTEAINYIKDDNDVMECGEGRMHITETQHQSDGQVAWFDTSKFPLLDIRGQVVGVIGVSNDITKLKIIELELLNRNKELVYQNQEKEKRADELIIANKVLNSLIIERNAAEEQINKLNAELELKVEKRTEQLAETNKNLYEEIEERKVSEQKLREKEVSLHDAQRMAKMGDWEWNMLTQKSIWSDNYYKMLGLKPGTVEPSFDIFLSKLHNEDIILIKEYHSKLMLNLKPLFIEIRIIQPDGSIIWVQNAIESFSESGKITKLKGVIIDITERKKFEKEIKAAQQEAEGANLAKSEFLSRMSHELRTPMNSILGFAQLMDMGELKPAHKIGVGHILNSGKHLLGLINEVLDLSRIEAGELSLLFEKVPINKIVSDSMEITQLLADEKKITLVFKASEINNLLVIADTQKLKQVLLNLINNAIKYNHKGGSVRVECSKQFTDSSQQLAEDCTKIIRISVIDTGKGIAANDIQKLFNPFQRIGTDNYEIEGTGLGLAVAKKLMIAMNGTIGVESKVGEGSTFWIELPQAEN